MGLVLLVLGVLSVVGLLVVAVVYAAFWFVVVVFCAIAIVLTLLLGHGWGFLAAIPVTALIFWVIGAQGEKSD